KEGGERDRIAILVERQAPGAENQEELWILSVDGRVRASRSLGKAMQNGRRLVVHPTGQFLVVSEGEGAEIALYGKDDLSKKVQVLRSVGDTIKTVSFRKKGDARGLLLTDTSDRKMIFDFTNRALGKDDNTWETFSASTNGWAIDEKIGDDR